MGWQDRDYAGPGGRGFSARPVIKPRMPSTLTGCVMALVVIGAVLGVDIETVIEYGALKAGTVVPGVQLWRLATYPWVAPPSGGGAFSLVLDLLFRLAFLWLFGRMAEQLLTRARWLAVAGTGILAGALGMEAMWRLFPGHFSVPWVFGSMTLVYALMGACLVRAPRTPLGLFFLPMAIELRWMVAFIGGISFLVAVSGKPSASGEAANLIALGAGAAIARLGARLPDPFAAIRIKIHNWRHHRHAQSLNDHHSEVDRILAKIKREGMGNLTAAEKKTLKRDTARLRV